LAIGACVTVDAVIVDRDGRCLFGSSNARGTVRTVHRMVGWPGGCRAALRVVSSVNTHGRMSQRRRRAPTDPASFNRTGGSTELPIGAAGAARLRAVETGERMLIWCEGGPSIGRAVYFPPPLEIAVEGGLYVLVDGGAPENWHYAFVSATDTLR